MAQITRQRQGELVAGVFKLLANRPDGVPAKDVLAALREIVPATPFEAAEYPNRPGVVRYHKIVRFSTIPFVKAAWLVKTKGRWLATESGMSAYKQHESDPKAFMLEAVGHYRQWKKEQPEETDSETQVAEDAAESVGTLEEAQEQAFAEIKDYLDEMAPYDFQDLVAGLVEAAGYRIQWIAPPGPDRGIDIVASPDQLGITEPRIKVQVKHRTAAADVGDLRAFMAVLGDKDVGIYVSTGGFTRDAISEARSHVTRRLTLLDTEQLLDLWVSNYAKLDETKRLLLPLKPVYYLVRTPEPTA
jgi:restriction system protein